MLQTLEFPASELAEKIQRGEIAPNACVRVTVDVKLSDVPVDEEAARRVKAWEQAVEKHAVYGVVVDDSREGISGWDEERE